MSIIAQLVQVGGLFLGDPRGDRLADVGYWLLNFLIHKRILLFKPQKGDPNIAQAFEQFLDSQTQKTGTKPALAICGNLTRLGSANDFVEYTRYRDRELGPLCSSITDVPGATDVLGNIWKPDTYRSLQDRMFSLQNPLKLKTKRHLICMHPLVSCALPLRLGVSVELRQAGTEVWGRYSPEDIERIEINIRSADQEAQRSDLRAIHFIVSYHSVLYPWSFHFSQESRQRLLTLCLRHGISGILCKLGTLPDRLPFPSMTREPWPPEIPCPDVFVDSSAHPAAFLLHEFEDAEPTRLNWRVQHVVLSTKTTPHRFEAAQAVHLEITI